MHHLVERRCDQSAETDHVRLLLFGALKNFFAGDHHAQVDDVVVVAGEHHADDVLANIVNVALNRREENFSLRLDDLAGRHHRSEEHTSELQSRQYLVCRLLLEKKKKQNNKQENISTECVATYSHLSRVVM